MLRWVEQRCSNARQWSINLYYSHNTEMV